MTAVQDKSESTRPAANGSPLDAMLTDAALGPVRRLLPGRAALKLVGRLAARPVNTTRLGLHTTAELGKVSRIGVVATAGDRRDDDMRELGAVAAQHFDVVVVREDIGLRGRRRGETADLIAEGVRSAMGEGLRCKQVDVVLEELAATRHAIAHSNPGDLVILCVDQHGAVLAELESYGRQAQPGSRAEEDGLFDNAIADPDFTPGATPPDEEAPDKSFV